MKHPSTVALGPSDARDAIARHGRAPRTTAVPVLPPDAPEDAWLAARRDGIGASEIASVFGWSPHGSPFSLWWNKQRDWSTARSDAMHIGHKLEPVIGDLWAEDHPESAVWRPGARLWRHPEHEWMLATPDFIVASAIDPTTAIPLECKSDEGGAGWGPEGTDQIPNHHRLQLLQQMAVLGSPVGYLMRLAGKRRRGYVVYAADHTELMAETVRAGTAFMASLSTGVAPDIDAHEATERTLSALFPGVEPETMAYVNRAMATEFLEAARDLDRAKERNLLVRNKLREAMGTAQFAMTEGPDGADMRIATRRVYKRSGYEVGPTVVDQLVRSTSHGKGV